MGSCKVCEPLPKCGCLVLFVNAMLLPDPLPWVEFQTLVLINELLSLVNDGNFAPHPEGVKAEKSRRLFETRDSSRRHEK